MNIFFGIINLNKRTNKKKRASVGNKKKSFKLNQEDKRKINKQGEDLLAREKKNGIERYADCFEYEFGLLRVGA